ncbi:MAG: helix-turn-helix domain-containing protein [Pseudomonadota bacterium]|nr:helix-turn-helix domain-containing protein [Pseudomonadota bacterium]
MNTFRKPDDSDRAKGRELARLRKAVGQTQKQVALRVGVSEKQYGKYERGHTRLSAGRYDTIVKMLQKHAGHGGFEEGQLAYAPPASEKEALLRYLGAFESDLKSCQDRLRLCFEIVGRL